MSLNEGEGNVRQKRNNKVKGRTQHFLNLPIRAAATVLVLVESGKVRGTAFGSESFCSCFLVWPVTYSDIEG